MNASTAPRRGPLTGVTVIDLGQIYNGPYCTFMMAMAGAEVIKIEPIGGENLRRRAKVGGAALPFAMLNSNKRFVTLNLKHARGREMFLQMVGKADVLVENFSVHAMERLGLDYPVLSALNPGLVYASSTGYGRSGPMTAYPAMDIAVQAMSGVMSINGFEDRPPVKVGPAMADFAAGTHLYAAITSALFERQRTGFGQHVEVSMLESVYASLASNLGLYYAKQGQVSARTGNKHGGMAESPYNVYPTADGGYIAIVASSDEQWRRLLNAIGRAELIDDARYSTLKTRVARMAEVDEIVEAFTRAHSRDRAFAILMEASVTCAPVRDIGEVVNDPHLLERGAIEWTEHPLYGRIPLQRSPLRFGNAPEQTIEPSGEAGRDNAAVYQQWLGLSQKELAQLKNDEVI
jgi:crotonobetainyl-CoA:carnitine CoA-transferase CaiB-like acyl-CoA transferase